MRAIYDFIVSSVRMIIVVITAVSGAAIWVNAFFDSKVQAVETKIMSARSSDMHLLQTQLNDIKNDTNLIKNALIRGER